MKRNGETVQAVCHVQSEAQREDRRERGRDAMTVTNHSAACITLGWTQKKNKSGKSLDVIDEDHTHNRQ